MIKIKTLLLPLFLSMIVILSGCTTPGPGRTYYVHETIGGPDSLDPAVCYESAGGEVIQNVYEQLYWYDKGNIEEVIPWLATDLPDLSADGLNYTIPIRTEDANGDPILFHDGTPFNATGIEAAINHIMWVADIGGPGWMVWQFLKGAADAHSVIRNSRLSDAEREQAYYDWVASDAVETRAEDTELVLRLAEPYAGFDQIMAFWTYTAISPSAIAENQGPIGEGKEDNWFHRNMVGTGPYELKAWEVGEELVLEANEDYWGTPSDTGVAQLKTVYIRQVDELATRKLNLMEGSSDSAYWPTTEADEVYDEANEETHSKIDGLEVKTGPTLSIAEVHLTLHDTVNITGVGLVDNPLKDDEDGLKVRQALNHLLDYDAYLSEVLNGWGIEQNGVIPQGMFAHVEDLKEQYGYDYNETQALSLIEDAGYGSGNELTLYFQYNTGNEVRELSCLYFKDKLESLADWINVDVQGLDWSTYVDKLVTGNLMAYIIGWLPDYADPDNYITPYASSTGTFSGWEGYNGTFTELAVTGHGISVGDTVDEWIANARKETDSATRELIYEEIEAQLLRDAKYVYLYQSVTFRVQKTSVEGWFNNPITGQQWYYMYFE